MNLPSTIQIFTSPQAQLFDTMKSVVQTISFCCSTLFNSVLIWLILTKSPKKMGSYKYLMIYFSVFAIFFSVLDMVLRPNMISLSTGFIVITDIKNTFLGSVGEAVLISSLCGCFGCILAIISIHFIFRYFALERKGKLRYFRGEYLLAWLLTPAVVGEIWTAVTAYFCYPSELLMEYSKEYVQYNYNIPLENMTYIGSIYFIKDANGKWVPHGFALLGMTILFSIMAISVSILAYFASKCYTRIRTLIYEGESNFTKNLQKQLYKALVAQACIPMCFLFLPISLYLTFPLIGIESEFIGKLATVLYAMYPALDPLPIIFLIDNYRHTISAFFGCCVTKNRVNAEEEISRHVSTTS